VCTVAKTEDDNTRSKSSFIELLVAIPRDSDNSDRGSTEGDGHGPRSGVRSESAPFPNWKGTTSWHDELPRKTTCTCTCSQGERATLTRPWHSNEATTFSRWRVRHVAKVQPLHFAEFLLDEPNEPPGVRCAHR